MKTRIALVVICLVLLPTAMLSLMAGRTLRSWELVLRRGLETTAANAVESVVDRTQAYLGQDLKRVRTAFLKPWRAEEATRDSRLRPRNW